MKTAAAALLLLTSSCISVPARTKPGVAPTITESTSIERIEGDPAHRAMVGASTFEYHENPAFMVGYIEFDDQGWFYNTDQFKVVREQIEQQILHGDKQTGGAVPAIIVAFVHGWRHSADVCDRDVVCFREVLRGLAVYEQARAEECRRTLGSGLSKCVERKIAGVMLAWRGSPIRPRAGVLRSSVEKLNVLSFYSRKSAAHQIGQAGYVASVVGWLHALDRNLDEQGKISRLVFAGHSFGGAMLFSAVSGVLNEQIAEQLFKPGRPSPNDCKEFQPDGVGDLVVLLNPAFEALRYHSINDATRNLRDCERTRPPIFLTLASTNDFPNKVLFRVGRSLSSAFDRFTPGTDQRKATIAALGHYNPPEHPFDTNSLTPNKNKVGDQAPALAKEESSPHHCSCKYGMEDDALRELARRLYRRPSPGEKGAKYNPFAQVAAPANSSLPTSAKPQCDTPSCLTALGEFDPYLPFKIIETDPEIVDGHSGIYSVKLIDFLIRSVANTDHVNEK